MAVGEKTIKTKALQAQLAHWKEEASSLEGERKALNDRVRALQASLQESEGKLRAQAHILADVDEHRARQERFFDGKVELLKVAHADDTRGLEERVREVTAKLGEKDAELAELLGHQTSEQVRVSHAGQR